MVAILWFPLAPSLLAPIIILAPTLAGDHSLSYKVTAIANVLISLCSTDDVIEDTSLMLMYSLADDEFLNFLSEGHARLTILQA